VRDGVELAFVHEGAGGTPLLLVHGWPETMRGWWRVIEPLAAVGFEVIAPDLRGFGQSGLAPDDRYDPAAHSRDLHALVHDVLGHEQVVAAGGDLGAVVLIDLGLRFEGFIARQTLWNSPLPLLRDAYAEASLDPVPPRTRQAADYFLRQGTDADALAAELDTPARRRRYIAQFYGPRFWAGVGAYTPEEVDFHTEPFADADRLRASFGNYEVAFGRRPVPERARFSEPSPVLTLILYGPEDHVVSPGYPEMAALCFPNHVGPFVVSGAGHFLAWERPEVVTSALVHFMRPWSAEDLAAR
jgi:pimeloyl-ACP methyl ester carboxylesterase